ncbi:MULTISPECIES: YrdB family protein [Bacillaceae]|uniref:YrdB family protein n=1 Tax=Evansella alkalicola TaxID=745819 RepID=A0ABS6JSY5_9BACI|nr:YrdB family protein [Litchfieldia alkalitelluris]MBU9721685.1 YrdB family protein [Bacillus alkalicola]
MDLLKHLNIGIRFLLEIIVLLAFVNWGFTIGKSLIMKLLVGLGFPLFIIFIWGMFGSPAAPHQLSGIYRLILEVSIYALAFMAIYFSGHSRLAWLFLCVVLINTSFMHVWKQ